jgi:SHAQKYF class myb-like DNA-binding protein
VRDTSNESKGGPQIENSGRWQDEEHMRFRTALLKFGRKWSKVARYVRTRTDAQARSHAQKYLRKLRKYGANGQEEEFQILKARGISKLPAKAGDSPNESSDEGQSSSDGEVKGSATSSKK